jgi:iron complex outermembrane receptor protein
MAKNAWRARGRRLAVKIAMCTTILLGSIVPEAMAQTDVPDAPLIAQAARAFNIPAQPLADGLTQFGQQSGLQVSVNAALIQGLSTPGVSGVLTPRAALERLLAGTGLNGTVSNGGIVTLSREPTSGTGAPGDALNLPPVVVGAQLGQNLPPVFAGGQVARGADVGLLGNKDYMDTPFSISSYTAKTVRDQQARSVAEVLTNSDASVRAAIGIGNRYDAMTIRGFRVENADIAINGLYGLVPDFRVNPAPAERIELLKGPAAFLNGMAPQGGIGGSVNLVTKRAADEALTRVAIDYFSNTTFSALADVGRRFGEHKEYGIRVNGTFTGGNTPIDRQWVRNGSLSLGFDYQGESLRLSADVIYQNDYMAAAARGYTPVPGIQVPAAPNPRINLAQYYDYARAQSTTATIRAEYDISPNTMVYGTFGGNFFDFDKREAPGATILGYDGAASSTSTFQSGQSRNLTGEAGLRTKFNTGPIKHEVAFSANLLQQQFWLGQTSYSSYLTNIYAPTLGVILSPVTSFPQALSSTNLMSSLAFADTLSAVDGKLQLIVGARNQQIESTSYAPTGAPTFHFISSQLSPSVALLVKPTRELTFYGSYIQGLSPSAPPPPGAANPGQVFPPFRSTQYEVGAKLDLGTFGATLAAFQINMPNGIVDPITKVYGINGEQRNQGLELNVFGELWPDFRILGGIALLNARLTQTAGGQFNGNFAVGAPSVQSNLGVEWDLPFAPGLTAIARGIYTSEAYVSSDNTQKVPAWATLDIGARYRTVIAKTPVVLRATVTNLLDSNYWIANPTGYVISGMPRMAWVSLQADF